MACFFLAVALLLGAKWTPKSTEDTANAARALLETASWVEVKDNDGKTELRALAAKDEPKAEQAMRDYHDRYEKVADSYWEAEREYADAISQLNRQYLDRQEPVTVDHVIQYFRDRGKLKKQLVAKSPRMSVPKPPYRRVLRHGEWWELRFDQERENISTALFSSDTPSIYLRPSTASCGFHTGLPALVNRFPELLDRADGRNTRIEVREQVIVLERRQFQTYRLSQTDVAEAVASLQEAAPNATIDGDPESNTIFVLGFADEHKVVQQAIAQLRTSSKK